jgi:hypothetical protein
MVELKHPEEASTAAGKLPFSFCGEIYASGKHDVSNNYDYNIIKNLSFELKQTPLEDLIESILLTIDIHKKKL